MNMLSILFGKKSAASVPPIVTAARKGDIGKVRELLESGERVDCMDEAGQNLLTVAVHTGERNLVGLLLDYGADPEGDHGQPLHIAATNGNIGIVALLLDNGADIDRQSVFEQQTALHFASYKGHAGVAGYLIEKGANPGLRNYQNDTPLALARKFGNCDCVAILKSVG